MKLPLPALLGMPFKAFLPSVAVLAGFGVAAAVYASDSSGPARAAVINPEPVAGVPSLASSFVVFDLRRSAGTPELVGDCGFKWKVSRAVRNGDMVRIAAEVSDFAPDCSALTLRLKAGGKDVPVAIVRPTTRTRVWSYLADLPDAVLEAKAATLTGSGAAGLSARARWEAKTAQEIREARATEVPYLTPVAGKPVPTDATSVPNARRPYRADITDGIHHSWDFYAPKGTPVRAVADGVVIRVHMGFSWADFDRVIKAPKSDEDRATNLDVFRGNQVWIKDAGGNVWMYNHLGGGAAGLSEGDAVARGQTLGFVGVSGVPDKDYLNSHLDISFAQNPREASRAGTWTYLETMGWDWWGKGMGNRWALEHGPALFSPK